MFRQSTNRSNAFSTRVSGLKMRASVLFPRIPRDIQRCAAEQNIILAAISSICESKILGNNGFSSESIPIRCLSKISRKCRLQPTGGVAVTMSIPEVKVNLTSVYSRKTASTWKRMTSSPWFSIATIAVYQSLTSARTQNMIWSSILLTVNSHGNCMLFWRSRRAEFLF